MDMGKVKSGLGDEQLTVFSKVDEIRRLKAAGVTQLQPEKNPVWRTNLCALIKRTRKPVIITKWDK